MALDDDQPLSGAQFARQVGADPEKWAARFLDAAGELDVSRTRAERIAFTTAWFRDAMDAAVKAARQEWPPDPEWEENRRRAKVAREHEVARRHSGGSSE